MNRIRFLVVFGAVLVVGLTSDVAFAKSLANTCRAFAGFDQNGDGQAEIRSLRSIESCGSSGRCALVLVEARLLKPLPGAADLTVLLKRLATDLADEGYVANLISVELEPNSLHQDGRYLLAIREFLRAVAKDGDLAGVILVGRFPDSLLVRTCNWRRQGDVSVGRTKAESKAFKNVHYLRRVPEIVAHRADIVLSDLNGRWEDVYVQAPTPLESVVAVSPGAIPEHGGVCQAIDRGTRTEEDCFHISDGELKVVESRGDSGEAVTSIVVSDLKADLECGTDDSSTSNRMARPDILVSRLDARGSAWSPRKSVVGADGSGLLDKHGRPQAVQFESKDKVPNWREGLWEPDPILERRLLCDYLDRNHAYRTGCASIFWRVSSIACGLGSGYRVMRRAASDWIEGDPKLADIAGRPTLVDFTKWIHYPAVLRTVRAHSDPQTSAFRRSSPADLDAAIGGPAWSWTPRGERLESSLAAACGGGRLNWFLLRTLWENHVVAPEPAIYLHTGCEGISPPGARSLPYDNPAYGARQGAEAILFFGNGLTLVGRAKVFYDEPRGFAEALRDGKSIGAAWARYFETESQAGSWGEAGGNIGRKRAYFWSVLGDWSLRLSKPRGQRSAAAKS